MYIYVSACVSVNMYICIYMCEHVCMSIFAYVNIFTNKWLKLHYKEPRPSEKEESGIPIKMADPDIFGMPTADIYGFPSGHAQQVVFSVFYLYFVKMIIVFGKSKLNFSCKIFHFVL